MANKKVRSSGRVIDGRSKFILSARNLLSYANKNSNKHYFLYAVLLRYFDRLVIHLGHQKVGRIVKFILNQLKKVANSPADIVGIISERKFFVLKRLEPDKKGIGNLLDEEASKIASKIIELTSKGLRFGGKEVRPSINIGISIFPKDGKKIDDLMKSAEVALEEAEKKGSNTFSVFVGEQGLKIGQGGRLLNELYEAMQGGKMYVVFQPIVDLKNGMRIKMIELLLRWRGQDIGPEKIMSLSEEVGISQIVNEFIFRKLSDISQKLQKYYFSFNILPRYLTASFLKSMIDSVEKHNVQAERIYLEISERSGFEEVEEFLRNIKLLNEAGFKFVIDDFGSPSSILSHLKDIPAEIVKVDKSIIREAGAGDKFSQAIIRGIVQVAKDIGMKTCAEGVEAREELELVRDYGFDFVQGFLISPPIPEEELLVL